jgi:hypothetical protein
MTALDQIASSGYFSTALAAKVAAFVASETRSPTPSDMRPTMQAQRISLGLVMACGLAPGGCATVPPSPERLVTTGTSFSAGRALQDFALPAGKVGEAVSDAMADLKMTSIEPAREGVVYKIQAKTADKRTVLVTLRPHQTQTRVGCRIGTFGDEQLSRALLERTGVRLGILPAAAIPEQVPSSPGSNPFFSRDAVSDEEMLKDVAEAPYRDRVVP